MKGWILYTYPPHPPEGGCYEINRLLEEAKELNIDLRVLSSEEIDLIVTRDDRKSVIANQQTGELPDFLMPRMGSGSTYYDLAVIRHLQRLGVPTFNSAESIESVKDKLFTQQILAQNNLPIPRTMLAKSPLDVEQVERLLGFPIVVKTLSGSQGAGVFLAENKDKFLDLMEFLESTDTKANIILQEFVPAGKGSDLRVFVVGGRAITCMKRISVNGSFKTNISRGGKAEPYEMKEEIAWLATETARILNLDIAGVDLLFDDDHFKVCEANSAPQFRGLESCQKINIAKHIINYIQIRLGMW